MSRTLTTFLFADRSFSEGAARVLDMGGTLNLYTSSATERQADFWATYADWRAVGQDIREAEKAYYRLLRQEQGNVQATGEPSIRTGEPAIR